MLQDLAAALIDGPSSPSVLPPPAAALAPLNPGAEPAKFPGPVTNDTAFHAERAKVDTTPPPAEAPPVRLARQAPAKATPQLGYVPPAPRTYSIFSPSDNVNWTGTDYAALKAYVDNRNRPAAPQYQQSQYYGGVTSGCANGQCGVSRPGMFGFFRRGR